MVRRKRRKNNRKIKKVSYDQAADSFSRAGCRFFYSFPTGNACCLCGRSYAHVMLSGAYLRHVILSERSESKRTALVNMWKTGKRCGIFNLCRIRTAGEKMREGEQEA